jgi:hypothetical protein
VDRIEGLGLGLGHLDALLRDDAQASLLDDRVDRAGEIAPRRIGLENGEGTLDSHR